jgi:uncharacterized membrane protein YgaE (UPF0421/DUF939 family)
VTGRRTDWRDRLAASDPGLNRLTAAARATLGVGSTLLVEFVVAQLVGQPAMIPMMLGAMLAMMVSFGIADTTRGGRAVTLLHLPVFMVAGMLVALSVDRYRVASLVVFVLVMFVAVLLRRFGPRYFVSGMVAFMGYFFALFLQLRIAQVPVVLMAIGVAAAWMMLLDLVLLPVRHDRVLRRLVHGFEARVQAVGEAAADLLAAGRPGPGERAAAPRTERLLGTLSGRLIRVNEAALIIDGQLGTPGAVVDDAAAEAVRRALFDGELAAAGLAEGARLLAACGHRLPEPVRGPANALLAAVRTGRWDVVAAQADLLDDLSGRLGGPLPVPGGDRRTPDPGVETAHVVRRMAASAQILVRARGEWTAAPAAASAPATGAAVADDAGFVPAVQLFGGNMPGSVKTIQAMLDGREGGWWTRISLTTRQAVQVAVATGLAIAAGDAVSGQRYYWAVLAAFLAFTGTATSAETVAKAVNRVLGTVIGIGLAIPLVGLTGHSIAVALPLALLSIFGAFYLFRVSYALMTFFFTLLVGELYALLGTFTPALMVLRLEETAVGGAIGCAVALVVLPTRARAAVTVARRLVLDQLHTLLDGLAAQLKDPAAAVDLPADARTLDAHLHQLLLLCTPLVRPALMAADNDRQRRLRIYTALAHHARRLARLAEQNRDLDPGRRAALGSAVDGIAVLVDALRAEDPRPDAVSSTATADLLSGIDVANPQVRVLVHELGYLLDALLSLAGSPGIVRAGTSVPRTSPAPGAPAHVLAGRVLSDGVPVPATVTLVDVHGRQRDRATTCGDGGYRLNPPEPGIHLLICTPTGDAAGEPFADWVLVPDRPVTHDISLPGPAGRAERTVAQPPAKGGRTSTVAPCVSPSVRSRTATSSTR